MRVSNGARVRSVPTADATNCVSWHPSCYLLAYACEDKNVEDRHVGAVRIMVPGV